MRNRVLIAIISIVMALSVMACGKGNDGPVNSKKENKETEEVTESEEEADTATTSQNTVVNTPDYGSLDDVPLYENVTPVVIDFNAAQYTPGTKIPGEQWDDTLFNRLEDVDASSTADGQLANCNVSRTFMQRADGNQELIEYEIYTDPATGKIVKIVALDFNGFGLYITDFYFENDKINFMYERYDTVYTPSYASIHRIGERHYFKDDAMVRWRINWEPEVIHDYGTAIYGSGYLEVYLFECEQSVWDVYEADEVENLNLAYSTYNAITQNNCVGKVTGTVRDTQGNAVPGAAAEIRRNSDNQLLYRFYADDTGAFDSYVYLDESECYMVVKGDESVYKPTVVKNVVLSSDSLYHTFNDITLFKLQGDSYMAHINVYDAMSVATDAEGTVTSTTLSNATVTIREGSDNRNGEIVGTYDMSTADANGNINASLMEGNYTLQIDSEGYATSFVDVTVIGGDVTASGYLVETPSAGQSTVVLAWEGDSDLDLTVFTPERAYDGNTAFIGGDNLSDSFGNRLYCDNRNGCEVVTLNSNDMGSYRIYVNDYTNSASVINTESIMANGRVVVYVYGPDGLIAKYSYPIGTPGLVWEVAEVSGTGTTVTPCNRTYTDITGKSYWYAEKGYIANANKLTADLNTQGNVYRLLSAISCYGSVENKNNLISGNPDELLTFYGMHSAGDDSYTSPFTFHYESAGDGCWWKSYSSVDGLSQDAYSITGRYVDLLSASNYVTEEYQGINCFVSERGARGGDGYLYVHDISSPEYIGNNEWKVSLTVYEHYDPILDGWHEVSDEKYCDLVFTLKANSSSLYGFNVTGCVQDGVDNNANSGNEESANLPSDEVSWSTIYTEFRRSPNESFGQYDLTPDYTRAQYCYIDGDDIPELVLPAYYSYSVIMAGMHVYTISDGRVVRYSSFYQSGDSKIQVGTSGLMDSGFYYYPYQNQFCIKQIYDGADGQPAQSTSTFDGGTWSYSNSSVSWGSTVSSPGTGWTQIKESDFS